jgi:hypothetical protein
MFNRLFCGISGLILLGACATRPAKEEPLPPPSSSVLEAKTETLVPITRAIIERAELTQENIGEIQFYVFGRIALEREDTEFSRRIEGRGNLIFEDVHNKEQIVFKNQTPGIGVEVIADGRQTTLAISFEEDKQLYRLRFRNVHDDPDEYFYLVYDPKVQNVDEKGSLVYGEKEYGVKYSGEKPPFLLINLEQTDIEQPYTRTVRGRLVRPVNNGTPAGE